MNKERIKSIAILSGTLITGMIIGLLIPALLHKVDRHGEKEHGKDLMPSKGEKAGWFGKTINHIVEPGADQEKKIKPVIDWAAARMDSLEAHANADATQLLDSVKVRLKPVLNAKQWEKLEKFDGKARERWGRRSKGHH